MKIDNGIRNGRLHAILIGALGDKRVVMSVQKKYLVEALGENRTITIDVVVGKSKRPCASLGLDASLRNIGAYDGVRVNWSAWGSGTPEVAIDFANGLLHAANLAIQLQRVLDETQPWRRLQ